MSSTGKLEKSRTFLKIAVLTLPLPWIAAELGWLVAEYGRQPWAIEGVLPTFLGVSSLSVLDVSISIAGFVLLYSTLAVIEVFLMVRSVKRGPDGLGHWPHDTAFLPTTSTPQSASAH